MYLDLEQARDLIINKAKHLINQLIDIKGNAKPPFLAQDYAYLKGIKKKQILKTDLGEVSASLFKFQDDYQIKVNETHNFVRQNFSIAHEIGHLMFNEFELGKYIRNRYSRTFNPQLVQRAQSNAIERLCDIAATELLMPEEVFSKYIASFGLSVNSIEPLSHVFRTSIQATTYRIAEVSTEPCLALIWKPCPPNKPKGLRYAGLRSPSRPYPLNTFVKPPSSLQTAFEGSLSVKSSISFRIGNNRKSLPIESKGFGRGENRYVVSLAFLAR